MNNHLSAANRRFQAGKGADVREPLLETTQTTVDETPQVVRGTRQFEFFVVLEPAFLVEKKNKVVHKVPSFAN